MLTNGSQFWTVETPTDVYVNGPGISLLKDKRLEAPMVVVGRVNKIIQAQDISPETEKLISSTLG